MTDLLAYLTDKCCEGRPELCAPNAFVPLEAICKPAQVRKARKSRTA